MEVKQPMTLKQKFNIAMIYEKFKEELAKKIEAGEVVRDPKTGVELTAADVQAMDLIFKK